MRYLPSEGKETEEVIGNTKVYLTVGAHLISMVWHLVDPTSYLEAYVENEGLHKEVGLKVKSDKIRTKKYPEEV